VLFEVLGRVTAASSAAAATPLAPTA
jgi:hypothetical protein